MTKGIIVSPANRGVQVVVTDENNVQLLVDSNRGVNLEIVPQPRIEVLVDKGVEGAQGPQGPQGPQGTAATVTAGTTTTGAAGTNAIVTNSGTSSAAVFDFTIPRGDTGATGATGAGVATGGTTGQFLQKASNANYDTTWSTITGTLVYQGSWNAATNTPTLTSSVGTNGYYYVVGTSGSTNLNGITDWVVGDWAIFNGSVWQKIDNTDLVSSVNGQTGVVVLDAADVGALAITNNLSDLANAPTARTNLGLGSIATQDANNVAITGGTINNTTIGATTPSTGVFTTLTATGQTSLGGVAGAEAFRAVTTASAVNYLQATGAIAGSSPNLSVQGSDTNIDLLLSSKGTSGTVVFRTNGTTRQAQISHTASAVNYVQVTGAATGGSPTFSAQGSDSNISFAFTQKGSGNLNFQTSGVTRHRVNGSDGSVDSGLSSSGGISLKALPVTNQVNYLQAAGNATGLGVQFSAQGSDTNISQVFQSKGTGAIDLAAGSSGVNISNGGSVTVITRTNSGAGYTTAPSVAVSAPTTAGGVQATASVSGFFPSAATVQAGGTGYTNGDVLTIVGGTGSATYTVTAVSGGAVTAVSVTTGSYSVLPTNPVSTTGGTGSGCTLNLTYTINTLTITNAGSGYVEQPTITFSGGGGSGAAAYATVGSGTTVRSLGNSSDLLVDTTSILHLRAKNTSGGNPTNTTAAFGLIPPQSNFGAPVFGFVSGPYLAWGGTGAMAFSSNASNPTISGNSGTEQFRVSHTASAVNYVQVTGSATTAFPVISSQGSDTNIGLTFASKGTSAIRFNTNSADQQFRISNTTGSDSYIEVKGGSSATGGVYITAAGAVRSMYLSSGSGASIRAFTGGEGTNEQFRVSHTASAVNYVQATGAATANEPQISAQGSDANVTLQLASKGFQPVKFLTGGATRQAQVSHTASAVNFLQITGGIATAAPVISSQGTDTNIDLTLTPKGTGNVRFGTYTANMALTIQGYIEIKDSGGTVRRLAVIA